MIDGAVWKEGGQWWGCWYKGYRIQCMRGGFKSSSIAQRWVNAGLVKERAA